MIINKNTNKYRLFKKNNLDIKYMYNNQSVKYNISLILKSFESLASSNKVVSIIARVVNHRNTRMFLTFREENNDLQGYLSKDSNFFENRKLIDNGDLLYISGVCKFTDSKEKTIFISEILFVSKCVVEISDQNFISEENKYFVEDRTKYLTLNKNAFNYLYSRFKIVNFIRSFFISNEFIEVETPILQKRYGGAIANPFITHYKFYDNYYYLRIAPELYLKRLIISGYTKIFEIAKNFRNESCSVMHNPEFSMLEAYIKSWFINDAINFIESFIIYLSHKIIMDDEIKIDKSIINKIIKTSFEVISFSDILCEMFGKNIDFDSWDDVEELSKKYNFKFIKENYNQPSEFYDDIITKVYIKNYKKEKILHLINHPKSISPLSKNFENVAMRFETYIFGIEVVDGFEEINDYQEQYNQFEYQSKILNNVYDEYYIKDLMLGMPNTTGFGIGIDRLISLMLGVDNIREIISYVN